MFTALGMVPPPENVRMNSVNFKNILRWESPAFPKGNLTFTAQYQRQVWAALGRRAPKDGGLDKNEILLQQTWMDLKGIMLSEMSDTKTNTVCFHLQIEFKKIK